MNNQAKETEMNIIELNNLIEAFENEDTDNTKILAFYYRKREELKAVLTKKINNIING